MRTKALFVAMLLAFAPLPSVAQDFDVGAAAYDLGIYDMAMEKWKPLAENGNHVAQSNLGVMYANGQGVEQDYAEAVRWFRSAAYNGEPRAQYNLGLMYANGQGVEQDYAEAVSWYRAAAVQGDADGQTALGLTYATGRGVTQNAIVSHMWLDIAAKNGNSDAFEGRKLLAVNLNSAKIAEAQRRARVCMASDYQDCE